MKASRRLSLLNLTNRKAEDFSATSGKLRIFLKAEDFSAISGYPKYFINQ
uniref:Uncharacterized protein n=1 Tax=Meloidogyne enterolobii TaxID=390850 RepID=A0A6V7WSR7_MELEN|nr:unnamed protein product [Meloidogyne enterolobii]